MRKRVPLGRVDPIEHEILVHDDCGREPGAGTREAIDGDCRLGSIAPQGARCYHRAMHVAVAQLDAIVGDLSGNGRRILDALREAERAGADLTVTPELSLCGYPPEDLLLRPAFVEANARELASIASEVTDSVLTVGFAEGHEGRRCNAVAVLRNGRVDQVYRKQALPNYTVFDEERYFAPGSDACVFPVGDLRVGVVICEDVWVPGPAAQARAAGAQVLVVPNGSPYHTSQLALRREQVAARAIENANADRLRESLRRAGRARVRRRLVRRRRDRHRGAADAGLARDARARVVRRRARAAGARRPR